MIRVEPELPDYTAEVHGSTLVIRGRSKGRTTYSVAIDAAISDVFGQTLGSAASVLFTVGPAEPALFSPGSDFMVLDPQAPPRFSVFSINQPSLKVRVYAVTPANWTQYREFRESFHRNIALAQPPDVSSSTESAVRGASDELTETTIDLDPALRKGLGHVVLSSSRPSSPRRNGDASRSWPGSRRRGSVWMPSLIPAVSLPGRRRSRMVGRSMASRSALCRRESR